MSKAAITALQHAMVWLLPIERELLLFAAFWFVIGTFDEICVDLCWLWLLATGRARARRLSPEEEVRPLRGRAAVFIPAWHEAEVIGPTVRHALRAWPQEGLALYVGCYRNDPATREAAMRGACGDPRLRLVIHDRDGPTTKADCLNRVYEALCEDEVRLGEAFASVIMHDAEDMVHPAALSVIDDALAEADFVQLPVRPEPQVTSQFVGGHYSDEFTEAHAKTLIVRDALGAAIPAAGVGCGFARDALARFAAEQARAGEAGPFASECLTEDYEIGLLFSRRGRGGCYVRLRDASGALVATRAYFPAHLEASVRQKTRWMHGIAFQSWERLGWTGRPVDLWMAIRDRRGPLTALVLAAAYALVVIEGVLGIGRWLGLVEAVAFGPVLRAALAISFVGFVWRAGWRLAFTTHEYGFAEGLRSILRFPVANIIAIMAGRRALFAYVRSLRGAAVSWDKTQHCSHPAAGLAEPAR